MVMETGQIKSLTDHVDAETVLDGGPALSLPVPVVKEDTIGKQVLMKFFYFYNTGLPPGPFNVHAPEDISEVNLATRDIVDFHPVTSKDFGVERDDTQPLGESDIDDDITMDDFREMETRFYVLYEQILPYFLSVEQEIPKEQKALICEFYDLFFTIENKLLKPYYYAMNPSFFDWLKQNSQ